VASTIAYTLFSQRVKALYCSLEEHDEEKWRDIALLASSFKVFASSVVPSEDTLASHLAGFSHL